MVLSGYQLVDLTWVGFANDEIAHYGAIDVCGVFIRTGVWLQHVQHSYWCVSCSLLINISGDTLGFWEWFALDQRWDHPQPRRRVAGPFEYRYYGRDNHWVDYAPPLVSSAKKRCLRFESPSNFISRGRVGGKTRRGLWSPSISSA